MTNSCRWCTRYKAEQYFNTESDYILPREYGLPPSCYGEKFWYHRVQLWGIGTEVIKNCDYTNQNEETKV